MKHTRAPWPLSFISPLPAEAGRRGAQTIPSCVGAEHAPWKKPGGTDGAQGPGSQTAARGFSSAVRCCERGPCPSRGPEGQPSSPAPWIVLTPIQSVQTPSEASAPPRVPPGPSLWSSLTWSSDRQAARGGGRARQLLSEATRRKGPGLTIAKETSPGMSRD